MPPTKRKLLRLHAGEQCSTKQSCTSPHVVLQPFMREESTRKKHCFSSLPASASIFNKPEMSDIRVRVHPTDKLYYAHRAILSAASEVFAAMLGGSWVESRSDVLEFHEEADCAEVFEIFMYFIYSGSVAIQDEYVVPLFLLAGKYDVRSLSDECAKLIERALHVFVLSDSERSADAEPSLVFSLHDSSSSSLASSSDVDLTDSSDLSDSEDAVSHGRSLRDVDWVPTRPQRSNHFVKTKSSTSVRPTSLHSTPKKTHMIASETFTVSVVLRLLDHCHGNERVCRAALFNLEARVGNQISLRNYSSVWLDLGVDVVTAMLSDSRFGYPEAILFGAAEAWLMARPERQHPETCTAVLKCIRYPLLPKKDLYDVQRSEIVKSNAEASALVLEAMRFKLFFDCSTDEDRLRWSGSQFKIRIIPKY